MDYISAVMCFEHVCFDAFLNANKLLKHLIVAHLH